MVSQVELMTQMCRGRSYNCIDWLARDFSYSMLMNIATNPLLPHVFRAATTDFARALYVDRFPQVCD